MLLSIANYRILALSILATFAIAVALRNIGQLRDRNGIDIPILKTSFRSNLVDFMSTTEVTIEFKNSLATEMLDVVYTQPIDPQAALFSMIVKVGDRTIKASAGEKEAAKKVFNDAKNAGHGAYLARINDDQPDVYSLSLGNVPAGETVVVSISYVTEVLLDDNRDDGSVLRFSIPLGLFQRYSPHHASSRSGFDSERSKAPSLGTPAEIAMDILVDIQMPCDIASPSSVPLTLTFGKHSHRMASVSAHPSSADGDFVLLIERSEPFTSSLWLPDESLASVDHQITSTMLSIYPNLPSAPLNEQLSEVIFIVDQSGSMSGQYIKTARSTLGACIASLPAGCRFQVIGFGSYFRPLFQDPLVTFDDRTKQVAMDHADAMEADMGGTEILEPIRHVAAIPKGDLPRNVLIITDGGVSNTEEVISFVRNHNVMTGSRFFTFGIGSGASRGLVEGCAREGGGASEMIDDSDARSGKVEEKVLRQLGRVLSPALTRVKLHWDFEDTASDPKTSADFPADSVLRAAAAAEYKRQEQPYRYFTHVHTTLLKRFLEFFILDDAPRIVKSLKPVGVISSQTPQEVPAVLRNTRQLVFTDLALSADALARMRQHSAAPGREAEGPVAKSVKYPPIVSVTGSTPDGPYREDISEVHFMDAKTLSLFAARALIREQEALHSLHTSNSAASLAEECKQRALALSLSTGLLCKWSSYVAVELRRGHPADAGEQQATKSAFIYSSRDAAGKDFNQRFATFRAMSTSSSSMRSISGATSHSTSSSSSSSGGGGLISYGQEFDPEKSCVRSIRGWIDEDYSQELFMSPDVFKDSTMFEANSERAKPTAATAATAALLGPKPRPKAAPAATPPTAPAPAAKKSVAPDLFECDDDDGGDLIGSKITPAAPAPEIATAPSPSTASTAAVVPLSLPAPPKLSRTSDGSRVMALLKLQGADGHWDDSPQLRRALSDPRGASGGSPLTLPSPPMPDSVVAPADAAAGWTTLLVLLFLLKEEAAQRSLWGLAAAKAARFVTRTTGWSVDLAAQPTAAAAALVVATKADDGNGSDNLAAVCLSTAPAYVRGAAAEFLASL